MGLDHRPAGPCFPAGQARHGLDLGEPSLRKSTAGYTSLRSDCLGSCNSAIAILVVINAWSIGSFLALWSFMETLRSKVSLLRCTEVLTRTDDGPVGLQW